jgi:hypothetical protein
MKRSLEYIQLDKIEFSLLNRNLVAALGGGGVECALSDLRLCAAVPLYGTRPGTVAIDKLLVDL